MLMLVLGVWFCPSCDEGHPHASLVMRAFFAAQWSCTGDGVLMAYQIAFDLGENQNQPFLLKVSQALPGGSPAAASGLACTQPMKIW